MIKKVLSPKSEGATLVVALLFLDTKRTGVAAFVRYTVPAAAKKEPQKRKKQKKENTMSSETKTTVTPEAIEMQTGSWHYGQPSTAATSDTQVSWQSDNPAVVAVNETSGYMYGVSSGTATVYAVTDDGEQAAYTVTVNDPIRVTDVTINNAPAQLNRGDVYQLCATVMPANAADKSLYWCSSDTTVATVEPDTGKLRALRTGYVQIRVSSTDGSLRCTCCTIKIKNTVQTSAQQTTASKTVTAGLHTDPVDVYNGSHTLHKTVMPLFGGQNLTLDLRYDSAKLARGVFGKGWYHNYEKHVTVYTDGGDYLVYDTPSTYYRYALSACEEKFYCTSPDRSGYVLTVDCSQPYPFVIDCNSQRTEYYDGNGQLAKIVDHQGYELLISNTFTCITLTDCVTGKHIYLDRDPSNYCVTCIRDDAGRRATMRYTCMDDTALLKEYLLTELCDVNGNKSTFSYDDSARMESGIDAEGVLYFTNTYDDTDKGYGYLVSQADANARGATTVEYDGSTRTLTDRNNRAMACIFNENGLLTSITDALGNTTTYAYDAHYNRTRETDALGNTVEKTYNAFNKPTSVTDKNGNTTTYTYDGKGNLTEITYPAVDGVVATESFYYDARNRLVSHTDRRDTTVDYIYDATTGLLTHKMIDDDVIAQYVYENGLLKSETDARGNTTTYTYNGFGKMASKTDAQGMTTLYEYDNLGNPTKVTDPLGNTVALVYDGNYRKLSATDACGNTTEYTYTANGKTATVKDAAGNLTANEYDNEDRLAKTTDAAGNVTAYTYDDLGRLTDKTFADNSKVEYAYDAIGNLVRETNQKGASTQKTYDANGNVLTVKDAANHVTRYTYDAMGRCATAVNAVGGTTVYEYSAAGDLLSETDPLGNKRTYTYDGRGNRLTETDPRGNTTTYTYDANHNLLTVKNALNQITTYTYDALNRCTSVKDALGHTTTYGYDALGRRITVTDPRGNTVTTHYDANGNVLKTVDAKGNTVSRASYNCLNLPAVVTDAQGKTATYTYTPLGAVESICDIWNRRTEFVYDNRGRNTEVQDHERGTARASYDTLGNRTGLLGPGGAATTYTYDAMGRKTAETTPSGSSVTYTYNALNVLSQLTNARGQTRTFTYDTAGRITGCVTPEGTVTYTYDANGNVLTVTDQNGTVTREYDALNRVTKCTDTNGKTVTYGYDWCGNLSQIGYPSGYSMIYYYDSCHNMIEAMAPMGQSTYYTYDENNRVTLERTPDGGSISYAYDEKGRLLSTVDRLPNGAVLLHYEYTYDALGRLIEEKDLAKSQKVCYTYDRLDRLTEFKRINTATGERLWWDTFPYDAAGNLSNVGQCDQNNRLVYYSLGNVPYDADGNMLAIPRGGATPHTFAYDSANRLISTMGCAYTYNAEGNRIRLQRTENGTDYDTTYVYDTNAPLPRLLEKTTNGITTCYAYGHGLLAEEKSGVLWQYKRYHFDRRGSTVALTQDMTVTDTLTYNAYGRLLSHTGDSFVIFGYNGRDGVITDANGLLYMRARYYSPVIRRFVNADIIHGDIANSVTLNRYAYANGNPAMNVDPTGLSVGLTAREKRLSLMEKRFHGGVKGILPTIETINRNFSEITSAYDKKGASNILQRTADMFLNYVNPSVLSKKNNVVIGVAPNIKVTAGTSIKKGDSADIELTSTLSKDHIAILEEVTFSDDDVSVTFSEEDVITISYSYEYDENTTISASISGVPHTMWSAEYAVHEKIPKNQTLSTNVKMTYTHTDHSSSSKSRAEGVEYSTNWQEVAHGASVATGILAGGILIYAIVNDFLLPGLGSLDNVALFSMGAAMLANAGQ